MTLWASADRRAQVWLGVAALLAVTNVLSLWTTIRVLKRPKDVIRIGCDGLPAVVRLAENYAEPNDVEIRAFVTNFSTFFARSDSFSLRQDLAWCAQRMEPKLRMDFLREAVGTKEQPGVLRVIEGLQRRAQIDPAQLEIQVDKSMYPWRARVKGVRQIVGSEAPPQAFQLELELVRATREEVLEGLLVYRINGGAPVGAPLAAR